MTTREKYSVRQSPKVVVIGGGIAGLTAAYRLHESGMDVHLYEARGRVGGRIFTTKIDGRTAELGGHNIRDGGQASNLTRLIDECALKLTASRVYLNHSYFNGENLIPVRQLLQEQQIDPETLKSTIDNLALTSSNIQEILEKLVHRDNPLYKVLSVRMAAYEGGTIDKLSPLYAETLFHMILGGICSVHQGNATIDNYIDLLSVKGGNALLCEEIKTRLKEKVYVHMPIKKVRKDGPNTFQLTFQNGEEVSADILILAIPCSVYEDITFTDDVIPSEKLHAICTIQYGKNAKILVPCTNFLPKMTGVVGDEIVSFFDSIERLLTIYYTGEKSLFSSETIAHSYNLAKPMINMGFGKNFPLHIEPQYAADNASLCYQNPVGYSWPNDCYAKGTYSYIASGQESMLTSTETQAGETFKTLFAPIENALYFAGEHASILSDVPGTMEAACESGERIARVILRSYSSKF